MVRSFLRRWCMHNQHELILFLIIIALVGAMSPLWRWFGQSDPDLIWRRATIFREAMRRLGWSR